MLPRCSGVGEVLSAPTLGAAAAALARAGWGTVAAILGQSYLSLTVLLTLYVILLGFCRSGGVGAMPGERAGRAGGRGGGGGGAFRVWVGGGGEGGRRPLPRAPPATAHPPTLPTLTHPPNLPTLTRPPINSLAGVPVVARRRPEYHGDPLAVRARLGGLGSQLAYAGEGGGVRACVRACLCAQSGWVGGCVGGWRLRAGACPTAQLQVASRAAHTPPTAPPPPPLQPRTRCRTSQPPSACCCCWSWALR